MSVLPSFGEVCAGARFLAALPRFLRTPVDPEVARAVVRQRLISREADFLALVHRAIYANPRSLYRALLAHAGCELGDVEHLVRAEGVEGALHVLLRQGVHLTVEELKGREPVIRGTLTLSVDANNLSNPAARGSLAAQTSGSRGRPSLVRLELASVAELAYTRAAALDARGARSWRLAYWDVPGGGLAAMLHYAKAGSPPVRWFSPVDTAMSTLYARHRWSARAMRWGGVLARTPLPIPEHVPVDRPRPIIDWLVAERRAGRTPLLVTYSSPAVRLCREAVEAGISLAGVRLMLYGEPITSARLAVVQRAGAQAVPVYVAVESGRIGEGCLAPEAADDVHVFEDVHALIQPGPEAPRGMPPTALLLSSIRPNARLILLNASLGDQAVVHDRACGCALETVGWRRHLHTIRSYEKLTAGGMTFLDADALQILENLLPARFGGIPTDYQLVEEEGEEGRPNLWLLVNPRLGPVDAGAVREAFLGAIGDGSAAQRMMAVVWRDLGLPRVKRAPPVMTGSGKILHLHLADGARARTSSPLARGLMTSF